MKYALATQDVQSGSLNPCTQVSQSAPAHMPTPSGSWKHVHVSSTSRKAWRVQLRQLRSGSKFRLHRLQSSPSHQPSESDASQLHPQVRDDDGLHSHGHWHEPWSQDGQEQRFAAFLAHPVETHRRCNGSNPNCLAPSRKTALCRNTARLNPRIGSDPSASRCTLR